MQFMGSRKSCSCTSGLCEGRVAVDGVIAPQLKVAGGWAEILVPQSAGMDSHKA